MNDLDPKSSPFPNSGGPSDPIANLQRQLSLLLLAVVMLSGILTIFLWRQHKYVSADLDVAKGGSGPALKVFAEAEKPAYDKFEAELVQFAKTHPDFAAHLAKFRVQLNTSLPAPAPAPAPAPKK